MRFFFADDFTPPASVSSTLADLMYLALFAAAISHLIKMWLPKPPMERQLNDLKEWLSDRLTKQDDDSIARLGRLRDHIDQENAKIHDRITSHGLSLYHLKGVVEGMRGHPHS